MKTRTQVIIIGILLTLYLGADLYFCLTTFRQNQANYAGVEVLYEIPWIGPLFTYQLDDLRAMAIIGFFLGQTSLLALWADRSQAKSYLRIPLAILLTAVLCWMISRHFDQPLFTDGIRPTEYFYLYGIHAILITTILSSLRIGIVLFQRLRTTKSQEKNEKAQFTLGFLLIWTTIFALLLGLGKEILFEPRWTPNRYLYFFIEIGVCNTVFALLAFATALFDMRRRWTMFLLFMTSFLILIQPLSWFETSLLDYETIPFFEYRQPPSTWATGMHAGFVLLANVQCLTILATLLPLRLCGLLARTDNQSRNNSDRSAPSRQKSIDG
jgi:hypothetical protein